MTIANGTLIRNTQRQLALVTSHPPTSGPITNAIPVHAVHDPIAAPRASPLNVVAITASPAGVSTAPSTPWRARATINVVPSGASGAEDGGDAEADDSEQEHSPGSEVVAERAADEEQ